MPSVWNEDLKWGKKSFLVVPQPSCSYTYQSACFSPFMVGCNAGGREYREEDGVFM